MPGRATVALPRRGGGSSPASGRVRDRGHNPTEQRDWAAR
jgi:hypothetical protein